MPVLLYFSDAKGGRWRVHDTVIENGKHIPVPLGDSYARQRVFVSENQKERRIYRFVEHEQHGINEPALERQFLDAQATTPRQKRPR